MNMSNNRINILVFNLFILLTTSCSDYNGLIDENVTGKPLSAIASVDNAYNLKKSSVTAFASGDNIGVYIAEYTLPASPVINQTNKYTNKEFIYGIPYWTVSDHSALYLTDNSVTAAAFAYYPYNPSMNSYALTAYPFSVAADQSQSSKSSDFLWATDLYITNFDNIIQLTFKHVLSRIIINIKHTDEEGVLGEITIPNKIINTLIDLNDGTTTPQALVKTIIPYTEVQSTDGYSRTVSAIIPAQKVSTNDPLVFIPVGTDIYLYSIDETLELKSGYSYTFNITVGDAVVTRSNKNEGTESNRRISLGSISPM